MQWFARIDRFMAGWTAWLVPLVLLMTRLWVASVFFHSGMLKLDSWDSTLFLFEDEYHVPLLPPDLAAYIGTAIELGGSTILALGILTRPVALFMFLFNIMAVVSYPTLWKTGFYDHQLWGAMLLMNALWGGGFFSADRLLAALPKRRMMATSL